MNTSQVTNFFNAFTSCLSIPNHRYLSWEHCYNFFKGERASSCPPRFDLLSLHLGFYLASWGMMRGSSVLLQKDYLIHVDAIKILWKSKYNSLWGKTWSSVVSDKSDIDLIFNKNGLKDELVSCYKSKGISPTDTLITKIILGTMGCIPAYDRFLIEGLRADGKTKNFGKKSFVQIIDSYGTMSGFLLPSYTSSVYLTLTYPQMKIIDCIFWQFGYYIDEIKTQLKKSPSGIPVTNGSSSYTLSKSGGSYKVGATSYSSIKDVVLAGWYKK
ncbi:MAG: hypothetical protein KBT22_06050 [Bacteroidales bacterium]|nr:hypothetical protein [Candidatus Scybalocola fimicaballi]